MTISDNKSWTLTTQKTTASEIDDLVVKGILSSVSRTLRNTTLLREKETYLPLSYPDDKSKSFPNPLGCFLWKSFEGRAYFNVPVVRAIWANIYIAHLNSLLCQQPYEN